ncbi:hypothetical protein BaRGS_00008807 [Batillaria attramentaria]|uniref:CWH43-like N-terminal domain-containing protein n=1 Tax=Batillaria attramentaria TaxID=370345 RepID=A0ABD0LLR9_9CAEN
MFVFLPSDTGTYPPESCLFGLLLAIYSFITAISVFVRWQQVRTYYETDGSRGLHRTNNVALGLGLTGAFGILLVANFQESNVIVVHLIGAFLAFGIGSVYLWLHTYISYKAQSLPGHKSYLRHFRLVTSFVITVSFTLVVVFAVRAGSKPEGKHWSASDKGFSDHVASTALEWVGAFLSAAYFASFFEEFRHFHVTLPVEFSESPVLDSYQVTGHTPENDLHNGHTNKAFVSTVS